MALSPAPWDVVLGQLPNGDALVVPGPTGPAGPQGVQGAAGAAGPTGPTGPVAAPLAKYILDTADAGLVNGIVVHRALGPDRVPTSPNAMDDEMVTPVTGYNSGLWTVWNAWPTSVPAFDALGGMRVDVGESDSGFYGIEQPFVFSSGWAFTAKVCLNALSPGPSTNRRFVGISIRNTALARIELLYASRLSQVSSLIYSKYNLPTTGISDTRVTMYDPTDWFYLRARGDASNVITEWSANGIAFNKIDSQPFYTGTPNRIGLFTMSNQVEAWSAYVQWFRRTG